MKHFAQNIKLKCFNVFIFSNVFKCEINQTSLFKPEQFWLQDDFSPKKCFDRKKPQPNELFSNAIEYVFALELQENIKNIQFTFSFVLIILLCC